MQIRGGCYSYHCIQQDETFGETKKKKNKYKKNKQNKNKKNKEKR